MGLVAAMGLMAGGQVLSGLISGKSAKDAATTAADAPARSAQLQQEMFEQTRTDLQPYREVATGVPLYGGYLSAEEAYLAANPDVAAEIAAGTGVGSAQEHYEKYGKREGREWIDRPTYTGGALNELAEYGRSRVPIPGTPTDIPRFDPSRNIPQFGDYGRVPEYDPNFDITQDPSYRFRQQEMERAINRNMAGMGKLTSGNRLAEIMERTGDLASQEYAAGYARHLQDYLTQRDTSGLQYGRDIDAFNAARQREQALYGRDVDAFNAARQREQELYGRGLTAYDLQRAEESDYLNRLASLANVGQTATTNTGQFGAAAAGRAGSYLSQAGQAQAAGQLGQAGAIGNTINNLAYLGGMYAMRPQSPQLTMPTATGGSGFYR